MRDIPLKLYCEYHPYTEYQELVISGLENKYYKVLTGDFIDVVCDFIELLDIHVFEVIAQPGYWIPIENAILAECEGKRNLRIRITNHWHYY